MEYNIYSDTNSHEKILTSNDPYVFMITSPDSPPIGHKQDNIVNQAIDDNISVSHKSTHKIEKADKKIQALNEDKAKHNNPQVLFLDPDYSNHNQEAMKAIEDERERIQKEQANVVSIIPAPKYNTQDTNKYTLMT